MCVCVLVSVCVSVCVCVCVCVCASACVCVSARVRAWCLEVDASHLHRVGGSVRHHLSIIQQTFCSWLRFLAFANE